MQSGRPPSIHRRRRARARGDEAFSLIEAAVAMLLLALVVTPIMTLVVSDGRASNQLHLRAEATDLATQALETAQYQAASGVAPIPGSATSTVYSGTDSFSLDLTWALTSQNGDSSSICTAPPGQTSSEIWSVSADVAWGTGTGKGHVVQATLISPGSADLANASAGEIAVPVYAPGDTTLLTDVPIDVSVSGTCIGSQCSGQQIPTDQHTSETSNTGNTGCAVFPDLYAGAGWSYTVTVVGPSGYVDPNLLSSSPTANGLPTRTGISVQPDTVTLVDNPNFIIAKGATMDVAFQTESFVAALGDTPLPSSISPSPDLAVTFQSSPLLCSGESTCVLGNATPTSGFDSVAPQSALLFPGPDTSPNYAAWAGDQPGSAPRSSLGWYGSTSPTTFTATGTTTGTITVAVYPLTLKVGDKVAGETISSLSAADAGGGDAFALAAASGTGATSATGVPLGQFVLSAVVSGAGTSDTVSWGGSSPVYVWVTPIGVCTSSSVMSQPCSTPSTQPVSVTVG